MPESIFVIVTAVGEVWGGGVGCDWRGGRGRDINGLGKRGGEGRGRGLRKLALNVLD